MFHSNGAPMFDDPELFDTYVQRFPIGMNFFLFFYELPLWENLKVYHLIYPMHIFKKKSSYLWRHISSKECDTLAIRRDLIS